MLNKLFLVFLLFFVPLTLNAFELNSELNFVRQDYGITGNYPHAYDLIAADNSNLGKVAMQWYDDKADIVLYDFEGTRVAYAKGYNIGDEFQIFYFNNDDQLLGWASIYYEWLGPSRNSMLYSADGKQLLKDRKGNLVTGIYLPDEQDKKYIAYYQTFYLHPFTFELQLRDTEYFSENVDSDLFILYVASRLTPVASRLTPGMYHQTNKEKFPSLGE